MLIIRKENIVLSQFECNYCIQRSTFRKNNYWKSCVVPDISTTIELQLLHSNCTFRIYTTTKQQVYRVFLVRYEHDMTCVACVLAVELKVSQRKTLRG